jgi:hypothetical protein
MVRVNTVVNAAGARIFPRPLSIIPKVVISCFLAAFSFCSSAAADTDASELRVIDRSGLARLVAQVHGAEAIEVHLIESNQEHIGSWTLVHVDGLSPNVRGEMRGSALVLFPKVSAGTWRLTQVPPSPIKVRDIKLSKGE